MDKKAKVKKYKQEYKELNDILNEWDLLQLSEDVDDEYQDLINPILNSLMQNPSKEELATLIDRLVADWYGLPAKRLDLEIAEKILEWWDEKKSNSFTKLVDDNKSEKEIVNLALKEITQPLLKELGFHKKNRVFYREEGEFYQAIQFEGHYFKGVVSVNLYVLLKDIPKFYGEEKVFYQPSQAHGHFVNYFSWRKIDKSQKNINNAINELTQDIIKEGVPWLENLSNYKNIVNIFENEKDKLLVKYHIGVWAGLLETVAYKNIGDYKNAYSSITTLIQSKSFSSFGKGLQDFSKELQKELNQQ